MPKKLLRRSRATSFVGRIAVLDRAHEQLQVSRLVSLCGVGGVGKTRISFEIAQRESHRFRDGVCFVELGTIERDAQVIEAILSALAVPDQSNRPAEARLLRWIRNRQILLVLDNCEHVLAGVSQAVIAVLEATEEVSVIATSREALSVAGERTIVIPPLEVPSADMLPEEMVRTESVHLFVDRASDARPSFTGDNIAEIARLCTLLDGIPLAIELAATRLQSLSVQQIIERLSSRFELLTRGERNALPRQRTLRALIDWSFDLCTKKEQSLWARLSCFVGSFDLEAAEEVCGFGELERSTVFDILDSLISKSLLVAESGEGETRYTLLMTIREYGQELLEQSGDELTVRVRHRDYYHERALAMTQHWCGPDQAQMLYRMRSDHSNVLAALDWSLVNSEQNGVAAEMAYNLRYHWVAGGFLSDGRRYLEGCLTHAAQLPQGVVGGLLWVTAWVSLIQGDRQSAGSYLASAQHVAAATGNHELSIHVAQWTAEHDFFSGNAVVAVEKLTTVARDYLELGSTGSQLFAEFQLGFALCYCGRDTEALEICDASISLGQQHGEQWARSYALWVSGIALWHLGEFGVALEMTREALVLQSEFKDRICTALTIELRSWILTSQGKYRRAAELSVLAEIVWQRLGSSISAFGPDISADSALVGERLAGAISQRMVGELREQYRNLSPENIVSVALGESSETQVEMASARNFQLTKRELEVAKIVAEGLSNRHISERLYISVRTVDGHVESILTKLGFASRTQIATWCVEQGMTELL